MKVLVVEDNDFNLKLFNDLLLLMNHEVISCQSADLVIDIINVDSPDLILMDMQLGDASGLDIINLLKQDPKNSSIPIIAITAFAMKSDEERILRSGCDLYLAKPISIEVFFDAISKFEHNNKYEAVML